MNQPHQPRILRCPQCGASLEAAPFATNAQCRYCGSNVSLSVAPAPQLSETSRSRSKGPLLLVVVALVVFLGIGAMSALAVFRAAAAPTVAEPGPASTPAATQTARRPAAAVAAPPKAPAPPAVKRYPLHALLAVDPSVDIDGSRAHLLALFPGITSESIADELRYTIPLDHPWFGDAELRWKNEKAGKLSTVGLHPPSGETKLTHQKEIADCLTKGLGKPEVREVDHLAGELSYFFGRSFPRAWANVYSGYLWMSFETPKGVAPVTLPNILKTLDGCPSS